MKSVMMGMLLTLSFCSGQAQEQFAYYVEQIAALKIYDEILVKGYGIVKDGLQVINDLKHGDFNLHHHYFHSLKEINPSVRNTRADEMYANILSACLATTPLVKSLPPSEKDYVWRVITALKTTAKESHHQYALLTTSGNYQLTDDERLQQINSVMQELENAYAFIKKFHRALQVLLLQEQKERTDGKEMLKMIQP